MASESLTDSLEETLALFDPAGTPRTTSEVAEELDLGRRSTYERLDRLVQHGRLATKKVGASARVWWQPASDGGRSAADDGDLVENLPGMVYRCRAEPGWPLEYVGGHREDPFGYDAEALASGAVEWGEDVVHPEDRDRVDEAVRAGLDDDGEFSVRYRVRTADGGTRWVHDRGHVVDGATIEGVVTERRERERALDRERERFESFVDAVDEYAIFTLDADGTVRTWNEGAAQIKGFDRGEILGEHFSTFYTEDDRTTGLPEENLAAAAEAGSVQDEGWRVRKDGTRFWAHVTITALRDDDGTLRGFTKVTRDTTDRRERERAVREERNLLENVLETSPTGIGIFEADGQARRVNRRFAELMGLDGDAADEYALGDRPLRDDSGEVVPYHERPAPRALATGERVVDRRLRVDSESGTRWLSVTAAPLDEEDGVVVTVTDVTPLRERTRRLQRQREELESEFEEVVERVADGFYALDDRFRFTYVNEQAEELLGESEEELLGESVLDAFPGARDTPAWEAFHEAMEMGEKTSYEVYYEALEFWVEASVYPSESGLSVYFKDVTERKARERELERYAGILEAIEEPAYQLDEDGRMTFVNDAFVEYAGYERSELLGEHVSMGMDEAVVEEAESMLAAQLAGDEVEPVTLEVEVETADGERRPVENRFSVLTDDEGRFQGTAGLLLDLTERRERQRQLGRYETIVESIDEGVYAVDDDWRFTWVNRAYAELTGYDPEDLVGEPVLTVVDEDLVEAAREHDAALRDGEPAPGVVEVELRTADGESFPAAASFSLLETPDGERRRVGVVRDVTERTERERELERYETIVEAIDEGVYVVDGDGYFTWMNGAYAGMVGYDHEDLVGEHVSEVVDEETIRAAAEFEEQLVAGEDVGVVETELRTADRGTVPAAGTFAMLPEEDGERRRVGVVRDVTERKRYEEALAALYDSARELFRAETEVDVEDVVVETATDVLDVPGVGVYRYDEGEELLLPGTRSVESGFVREALPSVPPDDSTITGHVYATGETRLFDDIADSEYMGADVTEMRAGVFAPMGDYGVLIVGSGEVGAFDERTAQLVELLAETAAAAYDRVERELELERYGTIVEAVNEGIYVVDGDRHFTWVNESYADLVGYDREELVGEHVTEIVDEDAIREAEAEADGRGPEHLPRMDVELVTKSGERVAVDAASTVLPGDEESDWFRAGVVRDITERKERERAIEESERRYRTLVDNFPNGAVVLFDEDLRYLTVGGEIFDGFDFSADDLEGGLMADWLPEDLFEDLAPRYRAAFDGERREFEAEFEGEVRRFRVLPVHDEDGDVFAGVAMTQDVTREREREAALERQRERLAALNNLNDVVREITDAVVDQSTREEIEATVCEHLAATDSYLFAWVGDVDVASETVTLRTEAGVEGYLDDVAISIDAADEHGDGPTARALRTGEMQTTHDVRSDPDYEPWRDHAEAHGVRSSAAIPIVHEDTTYGVLNVYADRPDAFEGEERAVVGQLGEVVGHAIAAAERKRALLGDEVVELQFRIEDVFDGLDADGAGTVALDHVVPVGDDEFVVYGTATADAVGDVEALADHLPHWTDVTFRDAGVGEGDADGDGRGDANGDAEGGDGVGEGDGERAFELRLSEPPVLSRVASMGGSVADAVYEDGDYRMTVHLSPGVDVRRVIDAVEAAYPAAEMVKRRQTERREAAPESLDRVLAGALTDRQRVALEAAYHGGFFEWPRAVSGEEVAETLGVSPPTFHQHLRKAERKVLGSALSAASVP